MPLKRNKLLAFKTVAILLPFMVLLMFEGGLRLYGYGHDVRLFVEDEESQDSWVMNPHASERYFTMKENATIGVFESFKKKKLPGTLRIFVLGESTTLGYPYMASGSFDRWLLYRLIHTFPDRKFEIVNVSLTAVNSYTVLGFAREIVNYEPDAVMIYCGHNEYYGALGVGSTSQLGGNRILIQSVLYLRSFRTFQLLENTWSGIRRTLSGKSTDTHESLMKRMAGKQEIPIRSLLYDRGIEQFRVNMEKVCNVFSGKKIPVFISNLVSNEKDQKPFISSRKDTAISADYHYSLAGKAYQKGDFTRAKTLYDQAKDMDMLRFRAPEDMNAIIAGLPEKYPGVYLTDTKKIFEEHSPHGIIGKETILEHVHPNLMGYSLMSEAFYRSLKEHNIISPDFQQEMTLGQLQREMPITIVDSLKGDYEIRVLKERWPFNQPATNELTRDESYEAQLAMAMLYQKITWVKAMQNQLDYYTRRNDQKNTLKVAEASVLQIVNNSNYLLNVGKLCIEQNKTGKAKVYLQQAFCFSQIPETAQRLVILFLKDDQPEKALPYLTYLDQANPSRAVYSSTIALAKEIAGYKDRLKKEPANIGVLNLIALDYYNMQNTDVAMQYALKAFALDKKNQETIELLGKIKAMPGQKLN